MYNKLRVGILGATGMVGQQFIIFLKNHPWFRITVVAASYNSTGKTYENAVCGRWKMNELIPEHIKKLKVLNIFNVKQIASNVDFIFSAVNLNKQQIKFLEEQYARMEIPVISNNSAHRWTNDVPMVIPEINLNHFKLIKYQKKRLGTNNGFIVVKPNCSIQSYVPILAVWRDFKPYKIILTTYQGISGAGKNFKNWPEMIGNIIPFIKDEENKSENEPLRILGKFENGIIKMTDKLLITTQCVRVPVLNGHTVAVFVKFKQKPTKMQLINKIIDFNNDVYYKMHLPSAPKKFIKYIVKNDRPQVILDVNYNNGMSIIIGRLRHDIIYDYKFISLSHNIIRGAAGGSVLCAEALVYMGYIKKIE